MKGVQSRQEKETSSRCSRAGRKVERQGSSLTWGRYLMPGRELMFLISTSLGRSEPPEISLVH